MSNIKINIEKDGETFSQPINIEELNNKEIIIFFSELEDNRFSIFFDANIDIIYTFDFDNMNAELMCLYFIINGIQKYKPKSIHLTLPYLPYTGNDIVSEYYTDENILQLQTHSSFMKLLEISGVASITTYDMGNTQLKSYSDTYIYNIRKENIFIDTFDFFEKSKKPMFLISCHEDDFNSLNAKFGSKGNIKLINCSGYINFNNKREVLSSYLRIISKNPNVPIFIFDKSLNTGKKIYNILKSILKEVEVKEINMYITHAIFSQGSYKKFNNLCDEYKQVSITFYTTDSISGYSHHLNLKNLEVKSLQLLEEKVRTISFGEEKNQEDADSMDIHIEEADL